MKLLKKNEFTYFNYLTDANQGVRKEKPTHYIDVERKLRDYIIHLTEEAAVGWIQRSWYDNVSRIEKPYFH